jgi:hypothetical protein
MKRLSMVASSAKTNSSSQQLRLSLWAANRLQPFRVFLALRANILNNPEHASLQTTFINLIGIIRFTSDCLQTSQQ